MHIQTRTRSVFIQPAVTSRLGLQVLQNITFGAGISASCCPTYSAGLNRKIQTVLWIGFCLTGPISPCLNSFLLYMHYCIMCRIVTWWGGPGGIEAHFLGLLLPSVLW